MTARRPPQAVLGMLAPGDLVWDTSEPMRKRVVWTVIAVDADYVWLKDVSVPFSKYRSTHSGDCVRV